MTTQNCEVCGHVWGTHRAIGDHSYCSLCEVPVLIVVPYKRCRVLGRYSTREAVNFDPAPLVESDQGVSGRPALPLARDQDREWNSTILVPACPPYALVGWQPVRIRTPVTIRGLQSPSAAFL